MTERVRADGKFFAIGKQRFNFRGVTYGTFAARADGALVPERTTLKHDFEAINRAGFTVVRTYTEPPEDFRELAADWGLRILAGAFYSDWRYMVGTSRRQQRRLRQDARQIVRQTARRLAGDSQVLGIAVGNEIPADVVRWLGTDYVAQTIRELADVVHDEDPELLVTYGNYPTSEYLPLDTLDFLTFNVFLERRDDFRRYLTRLHHLAGDRPLVLGEVGFDSRATAAGEQEQAAMLAWQLETALERGVAGTCVFSWTDDWWVDERLVDGWHFGLTRTDRSPRPALDVAARWSTKSVRDLDFDWPSMSVIICAYNAAATIDECLAHTCALDYPDLEILVVDDGSTDSTAEITRRHPRARLVSIDHAGLSVARNEGSRVSTGDLIAYLDSDSYPSPEWPYYLALGFDASDVGGAGGPNVAPVDDPLGAHVVARSPGGPVHVLLSDDRAEHVPGCNMAFWRDVLAEVGGFDPVYTSAGDDVDVCWKVLDRDWQIGFHPAALVWHHRRPGFRAYLRQQRGYGRSEALVEARHPDRFTPAGTARWRGRIYNSLTPGLLRQRVYRGVYGAAAYQSVYQGGGHMVDLAHQVGVPLAAVLLLTLPLLLLSPFFLLPAGAALVLLAALSAIDVVRATPPRDLRGRRHRLLFRANVALHHLAQPLVRTWGRSRNRHVARKELPPHQPAPVPIRRLRNGVFLFVEDQPRAELVASLVGRLRRAGARLIPAGGWETYDARLVSSTLLYGDVQTSSHPPGYVQLRIRSRLRGRRLAIAATLAALALPLEAMVSLGALGFLAVEIMRGERRNRRILDRIVPRPHPSRGEAASRAEQAEAA